MQMYRFIPKRRAARLGLATLACALTTAVAFPLHHVLDLANIVMLFLLTVFLVAAFLGRGPALLASFLAVALFDFFFVPPQLSFDVADAQYLVTFAVMLSVGLATAHLTSRIAEQVGQARAKELETRQLYEAAREMSGAHTLDQVAAAARAYLEGLGIGGHLLVTDGTGMLAEQPGGPHRLGEMERSFAESAYERNDVIEAYDLARVGLATDYFPLRAPSSIQGVLAVTPRTIDTSEVRERRQAIEALASLAALSLERLSYAEAAKRSDMAIAEERLRTSVLSSLSHDLRTPLTTLVGLADSLTQQRSKLPAEAAEMADVIRVQADAMHRLLSDLLDMARLQGTNTALRREWLPFEEVVGSSLRLVEGAWSGREVTVDLGKDLPLVFFDAVLVERVLCNLLENAFKYSPVDARIDLSARHDGERLLVAVCNEGANFPHDRLDAMFDMFVRGRVESSVPGVGLGLAICKAIVVAHGGSIHAENTAGGACVRFTLPSESPPPIEEDTP